MTTPGTDPAGSAAETAREILRRTRTGCCATRSSLGSVAGPGRLSCLQLLALGRAERNWLPADRVPADRDHARLRRDPSGRRADRLVRGEACCAQALDCHLHR